MYYLNCREVRDDNCVALFLLTYLACGTRTSHEKGKKKERYRRLWRFGVITARLIYSEARTQLSETQRNCLSGSIFQLQDTRSSDTFYCSAGIVRLLY